MVNMQPSGQDEQMWFPKLPDGYEERQEQTMHSYANWQGMPGMAMTEWNGMPEMEMSGMGMADMGTQAFEMPGMEMAAAFPHDEMSGMAMPEMSNWHGMEHMEMVNEPRWNGNPEPPSHFGGPGFGPPMHGGPGFGPPMHGGPGFGPPMHGGPGFGPPMHGGPGFGPPMHGGPGHGGPGPHAQPPTTPPPFHTPSFPTHQTFAVDPGAIRGCLYRFTFVWLSRRNGFWFYPVFVGRRSVAGYRWNSRRRRWEYTGIDLNQIIRFTCS